jgi:hypothetical protein
MVTAFTSPRASIQAEVFAVERAMAENRTVAMRGLGDAGLWSPGGILLIYGPIGLGIAALVGVGVGIATKDAMRGAKWGGGVLAVEALIGGGYYAWQRIAPSETETSAAENRARLQRWYAVLDAAPQATMTVGATRSDARCVNEDPAPSSCFTCPPGTTITLDPRVPRGLGHFRCVPNGVTQFTV